MDSTGAEALLLDRTLEIVVVVNESGTLQYANSAMERVLGYAPDDICGQGAFELIHPEDRPTVESIFEHLIDTHTGADDDEPAAAPTEFRFRASDGSWVWLAAQMSAEPTLGSSEYVVSCRDISARRRAEDEHRRIHQRLIDITEHTNDVLWMFSPDWTEVLFINSAYENVWGRSVEELRANPADFVYGIHPADRDDAKQAMAQLSGGKPVNLECRVDATNSYQTWVWVQGHPLIDADGSISCLVGFARDVTDRRERERQLLVMDRLLRHNLRNEMNLILGHAEQARSHGGVAVEGDVARIVKTGEHLLQTVDKERDIVSLLTTSSDPITVDIVAVAADACDRVLECHPGVTIETVLPETASVRAVPKLSLAIYELLTNAIEHAEEAAPTLALTITADEESVELSVADECPPIPIQEIRVLRGERDVRSVYHGSGLGLWLVYWAVDRSGGDLEFETADWGNTVSISLDRVEA